MREAWTDERLDDLTKRVDEGFREARKDLRQFRGEVGSDLAKIDARFDKFEDKVEIKFDKVEDKFEALQQRFDRRFDLMFVTLLTGFASLIVAPFAG